MTAFVLRVVLTVVPLPRPLPVPTLKAPSGALKNRCAKAFGDFASQKVGKDSAQDNRSGLTFMLLAATAPDGWQLRLLEVRGSKRVIDHLFSRRRDISTSAGGFGDLS